MVLLLLYRCRFQNFLNNLVHSGHVCLCRPLVAIQPRKNTNFLERSPSTSTVFWKKKHSSTGFARAAIRRLTVTETRYIIVTTDQQIEFDLRIKRNEVSLSLWIIESDKHLKWPLLLYGSWAQPVLRLDLCSTMNYKIAFMACTWLWTKKFHSGSAMI